MNIKLSQQVSATYARNHFKEVNDKAINEGICVIVKKSKPITVILPMEEYEKMKKREEEYEFDLCRKKGPQKKISREELRKNSVFTKYIGCVEKVHGNIDSVKLAHKWTDYVD